jgi:hypothetical protein
VVREVIFVPFSFYWHAFYIAQIPNQMFSVNRSNYDIVENMVRQYFYEILPALP